MIRNFDTRRLGPLDGFRLDGWRPFLGEVAGEGPKAATRGERAEL